MEQITADNDSEEYKEEDITPAAPSDTASDTTQSINLNPFFSPRTWSVGSSSATATATSKSTGKRPAVPAKSPAAVKNSKKVFKQIEILSSDGDSENEAEYVPPRNYMDDGDDDSSDDESADSASDVERKKETILAEINQGLPEESHLSRKRKVKASQGIYKRAGVKKASSNKRARSAYDRVRDFPDDQLSVMGGKLICRACCVQDLSLKISSLKAHVKTESHKKNLERRDKNQLTLLSYKKIVQTSEKEDFTAGATLSLDTNAYRMAVCHAILRSGVPFTVLDTGSEIRELLEDGHSKLPKQSCTDLIPALNKREHFEVLRELNEVEAFSICSDGTINVAEALAVVGQRNFNS